MRFHAVVALSGVFIASGLELADAQPKERPRSEGITVKQQRVHKKGVYGGVQPGKPVPKVYSKKRPVKNRSRRAKRVTWVGFQPEEGGRARVFVQLTSEVGYSQRVEGDTLVVTLEDARFGSRNARRFLDTRFFDTALARVDANRARAPATGKRKRRRFLRKGVDVRITFKNPADATQASASMSKNDTDGYYYLFLDFGKGSGASATPAGGDDDDDTTTGDDDDDEIPEGIKDSES